MEREKDFKAVNGHSIKTVKINEHLDQVKNQNFKKEWKEWERKRKKGNMVKERKGKNVETEEKKES